MANMVVTPTWVMKEIVRRFVNTLRFAAHVNRSYSDEFVQGGAKVGLTVNARLPQRFKVNKGQALVIQSTQDNIVPITLTDQANVGIEFSMASLKMEIDNYRDRYIAPAVDALVNTFDYDGLQRSYKDVYWTVGTPGVIPGSTGTLPGAANLVYLNAGVKLSKAAVPASGRVAILDPSMHAYLSSANMTLFNPASNLSKQYRTGQFGGEALGISEWFMDQNVATHTVGPLGGTPLIDGASQTGASILTKGWTSAAASRLLKGDVLQLAGVYAVNPMNYQSTGQLQDFVVTADFSSDASGNGTVSISPSIIVTGNMQTVTASPADAAAITIFGHASSYANVATPQGLVFWPDAFAAVTVDLELPGNQWVAERISNKALGVSVRFLKDYDIMSDQSPARIDMMYGWKTIRPEAAVRIAS